MFYTPEQKGLNAAQIDEICEKLWKEYSGELKNCHDCGAKPGEQHEEGCDVARCTSCGGQRLACDCKDGETDVWAGMWPGIKECYEQKLICFAEHCGINQWRFDLNVLYAKNL
jgi:hypothetical protein